MRDVSQFKLLNIKGDCFDIIVSSIVAWLKGEYRFLFKKCLGFAYNTIYSCIGERMNPYKGDIIEAAIDNRIKVNFYKKINYGLLFSLVKEVNPLMLEVDGYNCIWRNTYQKIHKNHYILVFDYSEEIEQFICMDMFPENNNLRLSPEFIMENTIRIISLSEDRIGYQILEAEDYLSQIVLSFHRDCTISSMQHLRIFIEKLPGIIDLKKELLGYEEVDVVYCPIVWNLKSIIWSFNQFLYLLNFISPNKMKKFIDIVKKIIINFEIITNQIIMRIIRKEYLLSTDKMKRYLGKVLSDEEKLIEGLELFCNEKNSDKDK